MRFCSIATWTFVGFLSLLLVSQNASAQNKKKATRKPAGVAYSAKGAREEIYKTASDTKLKLWIFTPRGHKPSDRSPAAVFFCRSDPTSRPPR